MTDCCLQCDCDKCLNQPSAVEFKPVEVGERALKSRALHLRMKAKRAATEAVELYRQAGLIDGHNQLLTKSNLRRRDDLETIMAMTNRELDALEMRSA